jgi:hypothetical protein
VTIVAARAARFETCERAPGAFLDRGARHAAGSDHPAQETADEVRHAMGSQLSVGVDLVAVLVGELARDAEAARTRP